MTEVKLHASELRLNKQFQIAWDCKRHVTHSTGDSPEMMYGISGSKSFSSFRVLSKNQTVSSSPYRIHLYPTPPTACSATTILFQEQWLWSIAQWDRHPCLEWSYKQQQWQRFHGVWPRDAVASVISVAKIVISSGFDRNYTVITYQYTVQNVITYSELRL